MQITADHLLPFLSNHLRAEVTGIEPVRQGEWSQTFFFTAGSQRKVIRFSAYDEDFLKDRFAARYASPHLPIPPVEEIGERFGLFYAISPRVEGKMIDELPEREMSRVVPALMDLLNALREVGGEGTYGYGGFDSNGNSPVLSWREHLTHTHSDAPGSRLQYWKARLAQNHEAAQTYQAGHRRLIELIPFCPEERHLIHNDLLHFNLIIQDDRVAGVIDWGCALWGDFLYDLAMFAAWQFYYPAMAGIDFTGAARRSFASRGVDLPNFDQRLQCYQVHLLLDGLIYNAWKEDARNLEITMRRLQEVLAGERGTS